MSRAAHVATHAPHRRARNATGIICFVALWAALAGSCGGGEISKEEYGRQVNDTLAEVEASYGSAGTKAAGGGGTGDAATTSADAVQQLQQTQIGLRDAGNQLAEIEPPAELEDEHDQLVQGVRDMADAIDTLIEAQQVAETDRAKASTLMEQFAKDQSFADVEAAARAIKKAGVDVTF